MPKKDIQIYTKIEKTSKDNKDNNSDNRITLTPISTIILSLILPSNIMGGLQGRI